VRGALKRFHTDNLVGMPRRSARSMSVLMATSPRSPSFGSTALLGHGDAATALKTAEPEHRFSPTEKREA
jgi:hypothetical protein